jgi:hypothetical protein
MAGTPPVMYRIEVDKKEESIFRHKFPRHATPESRQGEITPKDGRLKHLVCPLQYTFADCLVGKLWPLQIRQSAVSIGKCSHA